MTAHLLRRFLLLYFIAAALPCTAQNQPQPPPPSGQIPNSATPPPIRPEDLVVTVSSEAIPVSASTSVITVISAEQIRDSGVHNLSDILRQVPFLDMQRAGGQGGQTTVFIRGSKENLVMVMIDGIPINDITNRLGGSVDFSTLSTDNVERVEIVRGPMSALYGSEAIAGVINIISRRNEDVPSIALHAEGGNFSTGTFAASAVGRFKMFDYSLSGSYMTVGEQIGLDSYDLGTGALSSTADLGKQRFLQFSLRYQNRESAGYAEGSGGPEFALVREAEKDHTVGLIGGVAYQQQWKPWWLYSLNFDAFQQWDHNFTPPIWDQIPHTLYSLPSSLGTTNFRRLRFGESNNFKLSSAFLAHLGVVYQNEYGTENSVIAGTTPFDFDQNRNTLDVNTELIYQARRLTATVGLGINKTENYDTVLSPRVGANFLLTRNTHLKGTWGKGFFIPSFYALAEPVIGNPNLKPEFSNSFDVGIEQLLPRPHVKISATYFYNSMKDLVDFDSTLFLLVNRTSVLTQGFELASAYDITSRLQLSGQVSYLNWSLEGTTQPLRYVPHWRGGMNVDWRINSRLHTRVETLVLGPRFDYQIPVPNIETVGGYFLANLIVNYEVNDKLTANFRAENILNSNYHEYIGFPNPGIYVRAGVTYRFRLAQP
jgi:vitamin B12 transporter